MDTLLSQTLKVEQNKGSLVFDLGPRSRDMTISLFEARSVRYKLSSEEEIANIPASGPKMKKIRPLSFFQF